MLKNYNINEIGNYGVIYKLTSPSGKLYIGQSWKIKNRFGNYKRLNFNKKQIKLYNAIKKYGGLNFKYEIIDICETQTEMDNKENFYIELYDSVKHGYNVRYGGGCHGKFSEESIIKMKIAQLGKKMSEETKLKISLAKKGKRYSEEVKQNMKILANKHFRSHCIKLFEIIDNNNNVYYVKSLTRFCKYFKMKRIKKLKRIGKYEF